MRVLALVPYALGEAPGQRYRIEQWAPYLREEGVEFEFQAFATAKLAGALYARGGYARKALQMGLAFIRAAGRVRRAKQFDAVYLHREVSLVGPALLERLVHRCNARLVYDFDDAIWVRYVSPTNRYLSYLKTPGKTRTLCRLAAAVTVGNARLAEYASRYNRAVTLIPSTVSLREYRPRPFAPAAAVPVIGWTGSHSSAQYLRIVEEPLRALARRRRFRLRVIGIDSYSLAGVDIECLPWRAASEVEDLWPLDVGIMPLWDDQWSSGKCAMKAIQYMGIGIPAVVSPVGANATVVQHGVTGLHATTGAEWIEALDLLLADEARRSSFGRAGRERVAREFSAEANVPRLAALLRGLR